MPRTKIDPTAPVPFVATVKIDTREQLPFAFTGFSADARHGGAPLAVSTVRGTLPTGDYSLVGMEHVVAVERKSLADLFSTLGQGRDRFVRELERLSLFTVAAVVVESSLQDALVNPPSHSRLNPKTVHRSIIAWTQRYPRIHWWWCDTRELAEVTTLRILERAWTTYHGVVVESVGIGENVVPVALGQPAAEDGGCDADECNEYDECDESVTRNE